MPVSAPSTQVYYGLGPLPVIVLVLLVVGLVLAITRYRQGPRRSRAVAIIAFCVVLATVGGVFGYVTYQSYVQQNSWGFDYEVNIQGNGTAPEAIVIPIPEDESLLAGLHLTSGNANWSYVDTPKGRGLYVYFTGSAMIEASVSRFPRPAAPPNTNPTMIVASNCTVGMSNCTGLPSLGVFYSGTAGAHFYLVTDPWTAEGYLKTGWALYVVRPRVVT